MTAFAKGGSGTGTASTGNDGSTTPPPGNGNTVQASNTISEIVNTFTQTQIQATLQEEINKLNNVPTTPAETPAGHETSVPPPTQPRRLRNAGGAFLEFSSDYDLQSSDYTPGGGTLRSRSWSDFGLLFDSKTGSFAGAGTTLYANDGGGAKITFVPLPLSALELPDDVDVELPAGLFAGVAGTSAIQIYHDTEGTPLTPSELINLALRYCRTCQPTRRQR